MYRHVLCVFPYVKNLKRMRCFPPIGLEFIAAVLKPYCDYIDVIDLRYEEENVDAFIRPNTDMVCFSINWKRDIDYIKNQISLVPENITVIAGGRHATEDPEEWLKSCPNIDILVRGDGEDTIKDIASGKPLNEIKGLSYREKGGLAHTGNRVHDTLDDDLYPDRSLRRYDYRFDIEGIKTQWKFDSISASRGCPMNCKFCSFSMNPWGEKRPLAQRSPESVVRELGEIGAEFIVFTDDIFTHDVKWLERICDLILEKGIKKKYIINARLEVARHPDLLAKMEEAGFAVLLLGIESTKDSTLRSMNKGFNIEKIRKYCAVLKRTRMILHGYFILGLINETREDMMGIGPFAKNIGIDTLGLSTLRTSPFDGLRELIDQTHGYHITDDGVVYSNNISVGDMHRIRKKIWRNFYLSLNVMRTIVKFIRQGVVTPGVFANLLWAGIRAGARKLPLIGK